jgi:hypothetical protein
MTQGQARSGHQPILKELRYWFELLSRLACLPEHFILAFADLNNA